jgi:HlyD family secretion protein
MTAVSLSEEPDTNFKPFLYIAGSAIGVVFGGFGLWAAFAPLDSAAVAPAKVAVETDRKPIQHLEGGIVSEILVSEAAQVEEGQVLFRLQPTKAMANADMSRKQLDAMLALDARLVAELDGKPQIKFPEALLARLHVSETATAVADQNRQFIERRRSLDNQIGMTKARIDQMTRDIEGRKRRLSSLKDQMTSYTTEIEAVTSLAERGFYPRNKLLGLQRERTRVEADIGMTEAEISRLEDSIAEQRIQITQIEQRNVEDITQQLADTRAKISDLKEKIAIAEDVLGRIEVRAPRRGIVQGVKVHSVGAVVGPGATLAELVPIGETLIMAAKVSPLDVQSVTGGQRAEVRFPAFSTLQLPPVFGKVESVSADSMQEEGGKEQYYLARIAIDPKDIPAQVAAKIMPGMPADVLIVTGERTMLAYLIGPLRDRLARAMRDGH